MSSRPAAPRIASVSACASTSPSEWPASPRGWSIWTPPSTSATPSSSACASTPRPMRRSDTERLRKLIERSDPEIRLGRVVEVAPGAAPDVHGEHPCALGGAYVVVDAVADVGDLLRRDADF